MCDLYKNNGINYALIPRRGVAMCEAPPTISKVVRLAVQLQQLETHFLCDAQKDSVHPLQRRPAQVFSPVFNDKDLGNNQPQNTVFISSE